MFKQRMSRLVREIYGRKLCVVFESFKVKNCFTLKYKSNHFVLSHVVYKFTCQHDAGVSYIGETKRHLGIRASEHLKTEFSAIGSHVRQCPSCFISFSNGEMNHNNFKVIKKGDSKLDIEILEALLIRKCLPSLNRQLNFEGAAFTLRIFS